MDPTINPFSPGAGTPPPELAGRDELREKINIALKRIKNLLPTKSYLLVGLRGVGKTVLLNQMRKEAESYGIHTLSLEAPESRSFPAMLAPELRLALLRLSKIERSKSYADKALKCLAGFAKGLKVKFNDIEVGLDFEPEPGLADNGDLEHDLQDLLEATGEAAKQAGTAIAIFIDEVQYIETKELEALITALHRISQRQLPIVLIGAGLPQLRGRMGNAKSYAERLFDFPTIGPLTSKAAEQALRRPAEKNNVFIDDEAIQEILKATECYPYFLQEWGKHTWDLASQSPITKQDVGKATQMTIAALDESFFRVRFDRLSPVEKKYLRAMAELGGSPHRSGAIAELLNRESQSLSPTRNKLISKGMIWSPNYGDTAFTVPLFDQFMLRIMPGSDWKTAKCI